MIYCHLIAMETDNVTFLCAQWVSHYLLFTMRLSDELWQFIIIVPRLVAF